MKKITTILNATFQGKAIIFLLCLLIIPSLPAKPTQAAETLPILCAIIQYRVQDPDSVGRDADRLESFIREAAAKGAKLIVCPETTFYRYGKWVQNGTSQLDLANEYETLENRFSALSKELKISLVIGLREPSGASHPVYNTALFLGPGGKVLGKHHKILLSSNEQSFTQMGRSAVAFETPFGKVGLLICKDMDDNRFPGSLAAQGIDLLIGISGDPGRGWGKVQSGSQLAGAYGIGANQIGANSGSTFIGLSGFVSPAGVPLSGAGIDQGNNEGIYYHTLQLKYTAPKGLLIAVLKLLL